MSKTPHEMWQDIQFAKLAEQDKPAPALDLADSTALAELIAETEDEYDAPAPKRGRRKAD